ncbi:MAG: TonB-dependent receptor [Pseudomonadota bacterium]
MGRPNTLKNSTILTASAALLSTIPPQAFAQDPDLIDDDRIIVTGTKQGLTLQEAEVSVEVFDQARLDDENLFNLDDVLQRVPNVSSQSGSQITIRGISRSGTGGAGQGVTSNVYLDGAPISSAALAFGADSVWDIAQIEVLRGPQSTVQGRNALAGAIVLRTEDPTYEWEYKVRTRYQSFNTKQLAGVISGPIIEDQLAFRVSTDYQETDGFITDGINLSNQDEQDNLLIRGKLLWEPNAIPDLRAELTVDYNRLNRKILSSVAGPSVAGSPVITGDGSIVDFEPGFPDFDFDDFLSFPTNEETDGEILRFLADIQYELNENLNLEFIGTYEDSEILRNGGDVTNPLQNVGSVFNEDFLIDRNTQTYSAELRLAYEFGRFSGAIGGYYFEDQDDERAAFSIPIADIFGNAPVSPVTSALLGDEDLFFETQNFAFYGQTRFELDDKWTFDFSIRYDREEFRSPGQQLDGIRVVPADCFSPLPFNIVQGILSAATGSSADLSGATNADGFVTCQGIIDASVTSSAVPETTTFDAILPRGAVTYNVNDDVSVFASGQRGYRAGGTFTFPSGEGIQVGVFGPEFLTTYEVGFRSEWFDNRFRLNGNVFYSLYNEQQVQISGPTGATIDQRTINAGKSRLYGLELSGDYKPNDSLDIYGSLGLLRAEFTDFPFANTGPFENLEGNRLTNAPTVSFTIGANYKHSSGVFANASVNYQGPRESDIFNLDQNDFSRLVGRIDAEAAEDDDITPLDPRIANVTTRLESRIVANARVGYSEDRYSVYVYGSNLFNDNSPIIQNLAAVNATNSNLVPLAASNVGFAPPRVFGIGVDLTF